MGNKKGSKSARNFNTWLERGYSMEDALLEARKRMPGTVEYFQYFKGYSEDDAIRLSKEYGSNRAITLKNYIKKYGTDLGTLKFNEYRNKQSISNTYEYKREKYGWTKEQFKQFNLSRSQTKENFIKRYGVIDGTAKWDNYCNLQKTNGNTLEWFTMKYGDEEGTRIYNRVCLLKSHTYESYLLRSNGDIELANNLYTEYLTTKQLPYSKNSQELFRSILLDDEIQQHMVFFAELNQEWFLKYNGFDSTIFVDFFDQTAGKVIEFYGDYWHANPLLYESTDTVRLPGNQRPLAKEIWKKDQDRLDLMKKVPYIKDVLVIWEYDYNTNPTETINICKKFLKS
jgi:hypothetical protein